MIDELQRVAEIRPSADPASDTARAAARDRLDRAIVAEVLDPPAPRSGAAGGGPARRLRLPRLSAVIAFAGAAIAVAVFLGAIALVHHGGTAGTAGSHRHRAPIDPAADARLRVAGHAALSEALARNPGAVGGAFVALDPVTGQVYALGSVGRRGHKPRLDRAIGLAGTPGGTFEPIAALAALESGRWHADETYDDTGKWCVGPAPVICHTNLGGGRAGVIDTVAALRISDDVFFDNLAARMNSTAPGGGPLQRLARELGFGRTTGIDLPGEATGTVPTPATAAGGWPLGDNMNFALGQAGVAVTPIQLAVAYAAIANGGTVVVPRVGQGTAGSLAGAVAGRSPAPRAPGAVAGRSPAPRAPRRLRLDPTELHTVLAGMRAAAASPGGTSADVFGDFPLPVYGAVGSANHGVPDPTAPMGIRVTYNSWYAGFVPATATDRPIVVVVDVKGGGRGARTAAPVARQLLSQWFLDHRGPWRPGRSRAW
jgi:penicillin-binding protein 2